MLRRKALSIALVVCASVLQAAAATSVTTSRNDMARTGQNLQETQLTLANVRSSSFGKLFSYSVDGYVYAQPLYVSGLNIAGGTHSVVFVATEHDSVYAFDANQSQQLWHANLIDTSHGAASGATTMPSSETGSGDLQPEIGITGTPVIDPTSGTLYVVAKSKENGSYIQRLHALDLATGQEKANSPVLIRGSVPGTGSGSSGGNVAFQAKYQLNRAGLLLLNGQLYMAFGSHGDNGPYHGWIIAYDAATLAQTAIYNNSPNGSENGIWESGAGLAADTVGGNGRMFFANGNGSFDVSAPYTNSQSYGNAIERLDLGSNSMQVTDQWTPFDQAQLSSADTDQGSGGVLLLPDQPGAHIHELIQVGKNGRIELLDRDNLGGYDANSDNIVQEIGGQVGGMWSTPAYWNGNVYFWGNGDNLKQFRLTNGKLGNTPAVTSSVSSGFPNPQPVVSANGTNNAILWAIRGDGGSTNPAILFAFDATNVTTPIYASNQNSARDSAGGGVKFTVPTVADGKVFLGAVGEVDVYGLLAGAQPTAPTPTFSPAPGTYSTAQSVTLSDSQSAARIYYTTDGSVPTTSSNLYGGSIQVSASTTIKALAVLSGYNNSSVASGLYTIGVPPSSTINFSNGFASVAGLTLNGSAVHSDDSRLQLTTGAIHQAGSAFWNTPVNVQSFSTDFTFQLSGAGQLADGITFTIQNNVPTALGFDGGGLGYGADAPGSTPGIPNSVAIKFDLFSNAGEGNDSTGFYINGASPTTPFVDLSSTPINLGSGNSFSAHVAYDGSTLALTLKEPVTGATYTTSFTINIPQTIGSNTAYVGFTGGTGGLTASQKILTWVYTASSSAPPPPPPTAPTPTFSPAPGTYSATQNVTISDSQSGVQIYYTTDGSTPTTSSKLYGGPIQVSASATIKALAALSGYTNSSVASGAYVITTPVPSTIDFSNGFASVAGLTLNGSAVQSTTSSLQLTTSGGKNRAGSAFWNTPVNVQSFSTDFTFQLSGAGQLADGITFTIQNSKATALGPVGSGLGYGASQSGGTGGIAKSIAIKFDLYSNAGEGYDSTGFYINGASPTTPFVDLSKTGINLVSGDSFGAHVTYDGSMLTLTLKDLATAATFTTGLAINLPQTIGSNTAYVGFTGGTGGLTATQRILTWVYTANSSAPPPPPPPTAPTPTFSPAPGTYSAAQSVTISDSQTAARIYYTIDGSTPTTASNLYGGPLQINASTTIKALAVVAGDTNSSVASGAYTINTSSPRAINFSNGFASLAGLTLNGSAVGSAGSLQLTTNGGAHQAGSSFWNTPVSVQSFSTDFTFQLSGAGQLADGFTFTIQNSLPTAMGASGGALGYGADAPGGIPGISNSVAIKFDLYSNSGEGYDSTGFYINGASPTTPYVDLSSTGINLSGGDSFSAHVTYDGSMLTLTLKDLATAATFTTGLAINIPQTIGSNTAYVGFTGGTGGLTATQKILTWIY